MLMLLAGLITVAVVIWAVVSIVPIMNRGFSRIWQDPSQRNRAEAVKRLKELHINGHLPEETAVMMAAAERNTTEEELLEAAQMIHPSELKDVITGKRSWWGAIIHGVENALKRDANYREKH